MIAWPAGVLEAEWPANQAPTDNATVQFLVDNDTKPAEMTVHVSPAGLAPDALVAAWMVDHGCGRQARTLLATLK